MSRASLSYPLLMLTAMAMLWPCSVCWSQATQTVEATESDSNSEETKQTPAVVPVFSLNQALLEAPVGDDPLFGSIGAESMKNLVSRLEKVAKDDEVAGVIVLLGNAQMGRGQLEELYTAFRQIRDAGKPVYAHADFLSFGRLALLSSASRISVSPTGHLFVTGLYGSQPHVRGLLNKIDVTPDYITCGEYKSAAEMFMREAPSPEAEEMYDWLFDSLFETTVGQIADGREVPTETVHGWLDQGICSAEKAVELKIIDAAETVDDLLHHVKQEHGEDLKLEKRYGKSKSSTADLSNPFAVFKIWADLLKGSSSADRSKKDAVAIVYVQGAIMPGRPTPSPFSLQGAAAYSDPIRKALNKAAENDSIKAVVLRIDSPGGSAVGSEIILQATKELAKKKPLIVSMGDVAGSGGYYVACGADTIIADASTVTASIGVVGGKLATDEMWDSIGVHWHSLERGKHAGMLYSGQPFTDEQREILQNWMDEVYEVFKGHVVRNRGDRLKKPIDEIAGGRVYSGRQALELGLIDRIGTLSDGIRLAAEKAGIKDYDVRVVPRPKSFVELLMSDLVGDDNDEGQIELAPTAAAGWKTTSVWHAAQPVLQKLQPYQAEAIQRILLQLEVLQREQVSLAMPEFAIQP